MNTMQHVDELTIPVFNFSLEDLPGEIWKPVVGAEDFAVISQFGRVKRIGRESIANTGAIRYYEERIYRSAVKCLYCLRDGSYRYTLKCLISAPGFRLFFNPMRMVYYLFCREYPLLDSDYIISAINNDDLDIRPENLRLTYVYNAKGQALSTVRKFNADAKIRLYKKAALSKAVIYRRQLISCYNQSGKKVRTYKDIFQAHLRTGHPVSQIEEAISNSFTLLGIYYWRSGKEKVIDVTFIRQNRVKELKEIAGLRITQFDLSGNPINHYISLEDAAKSNGLKKADILSCMEGTKQMAGYFLWKAGHWDKPISGL